MFKYHIFLFKPDMDSLIHRLIKWTTKSVEPLQSYATGLLAAAMEIPDIATRFRYLIKTTLKSHE